MKYQFVMVSFKKNWKLKFHQDKNSESELESRSVISFVGRNTDGITISIDSDVNSRNHVYVQKTNQKVICTSRNRQNRW